MAQLESTSGRETAPAFSGRVQGWVRPGWGWQPEQIAASRAGLSSGLHGNPPPPCSVFSFIAWVTIAIAGDSDSQRLKVP